MPMIWAHEVPEHELSSLCFTIITYETPLILLTSLCVKDFEQLEPRNSFSQINMTLYWTELDLPAVGFKFSVRSLCSGTSQADISTGPVIYHPLLFLESRTLLCCFSFKPFHHFICLEESAKEKENRDAVQFSREGLSWCCIVVKSLLFLTMCQVDIFHCKLSHIL